MAFDFSDQDHTHINLTRVELDVLGQFLAGFTPEEAAYNLGLSLEAFEERLWMIHGKLQEAGGFETRNMLFPELTWMDEDDLGTAH